MTSTRPPSDMLVLIAISALAVAWLACTFTVLQLVELRARAAIGAMATVVAIGVLALATRNHELGLEWLRSTRLRSDALALGVLPAALATGTGALSTTVGRRSAWGPASASVASFAAAVVGVSALAIGRSGWYWEFVAVIASGAILVVTAGCTALHRDASPNARIAYLGIGMFGAFLLVGGGAMLAAWRALG